MDIDKELIINRVKQMLKQNDDNDSICNINVDVIENDDNTFDLDIK